MALIKQYSTVQHADQETEQNKYGLVYGFD